MTKPASEDQDSVQVAQLEDGTALCLRLKELRGSRSYAELARRTGIRADELSKIENGKTNSIAFATIARLLRELDAEPSQLFEILGMETGLDPIAAGMLRALERGAVSPAMADVWQRGEDRVYHDWSGWEETQEDESAQPTHRRSDL